jgi:hypothetical protein
MVKFSGRVIVFCGMVLAAGCAPQAENLPTLASVPTEAAVVGTLPSRPTLPPTFTPTGTETALPTETPTPTASVTVTASLVPSATITDTPSPTPTDEPTTPPQDRPVTGLLEIALRTTLLPTDFVVPAYQGIDVAIPPTPDPNAFVPVGTVIAPSGGTGSVVLPTNCAYFPPGNFATVYANAADLAVQIGCPSSNPPDILSVSSAWQPFQNGLMVWLSGDIYVLYNNGTYQYFADTFVQGVDPETVPDVPPSGLVTPVRGFAKIWSQNPAVKSGLGFALSGETGVPASVLPFQNGLMAALQGRSDTLILVGGKGTGTWRGVTG